MGLFSRSREPEMSERRRALIEKSDRAESKEWRLIFLAVILLLVVMFNLSDVVAQWFPNIEDADALIIAFPFALAGGVICRIELVKSMKSVRHATEAADYLEKDSVDVPERSDKFVIYKRYVRGSVRETSDDPNRF